LQALIGTATVMAAGVGAALTTRKTVSALDRVGTRRLILHIQKTLSTALRGYMFEPNDQRTREVLRHAVVDFMGSLQKRGALQSFSVRCDETNQTGNPQDLHVGIAFRRESWSEICVINCGIVGPPIERGSR
jgi:hypothetical protein